MAASPGAESANSSHTSVYAASAAPPPEQFAAPGRSGPARDARGRLVVYVEGTGALEPVAIPADRQPDWQHDKAYLWRVVEREAQSPLPTGNKSERVLVVTPGFILLTDLSGKVHRAAKLESLAFVATQTVVKSKTESEIIVLKFAPESAEPSLVLRLKHHALNAPGLNAQRCVDILAAARRARTGSFLTQEILSPEVSLWGVAHLLPFKKDAARYRAPADKAASWSREFEELQKVSLRSRPQTGEPSLLAPAEALIPEQVTSGMARDSARWSATASALGPEGAARHQSSQLEGGGDSQLLGAAAAGGGLRSGGDSDVSFTRFHGAVGEKKPLVFFDSIDSPLQSLEKETLGGTRFGKTALSLAEVASGVASPRLQSLAQARASNFLKPRDPVRVKLSATDQLWRIGTVTSVPNGVPLIAVGSAGESQYPVVEKIEPQGVYDVRRPSYITPEMGGKEAPGCYPLKEGDKVRVAALRDVEGETWAVLSSGAFSKVATRNGQRILGYDCGIQEAEEGLGTDEVAPVYGVHPGAFAGPDDGVVVREVEDVGVLEPVPLSNPTADPEHEESAAGSRRRSPSNRERAASASGKDGKDGKRGKGGPPPVSKCPIDVVVRVRPLAEGESAEFSVERQTASRGGEQTGLLCNGEHFSFDRVLWNPAPGALILKAGAPSIPGDEAPTVAYRKNLAEHTGTRLLSGQNCCILAYGASGSGKTHTVFGDDRAAAPGLALEVLCGLKREIAERVEKEDQGYLYNARLSVFELYAEKVRDLLDGIVVTESPKDQPVQDPWASVASNATASRRVVGVADGSVALTVGPAGSASFKKRRVRLHPVTGPYVEGLTHVDFMALSEQQLGGVLLAAKKVRATSPTHNNTESSRSHAVLQVVLVRSKKHGTTVGSLANLPEGSIQVSTLSIVDLAGSERARRYRSDDMASASRINLSLTVLRRVIDSLLHANEPPAANAAKTPRLPPYRESILTFLLSESLGGNACTTFIATISPSFSAVEDTLATLRYAARTKKIVNKVKTNILDDNRAIHEHNVMSPQVGDALAKQREELHLLASPGRLSPPVEFQLEARELRFETEGCEGRLSPTPDEFPVDPYAAHIWQHIAGSDNKALAIQTLLESVRREERETIEQALTAHWSHVEASRPLLSPFPPDGADPSAGPPLPPEELEMLRNLAKALSAQPAEIPSRIGGAEGIRSPPPPEEPGGSSPKKTVGFPPAVEAAGADASFASTRSYETLVMGSRPSRRDPAPDVTLEFKSIANTSHAYISSIAADSPAVVTPIPSRKRKPSLKSPSPELLMTPFAPVAHTPYRDRSEQQATPAFDASGENSYRKVLAELERREPLSLPSQRRLGHDPFCTPDSGSEPSPAPGRGAEIVVVDENNPLRFKESVRVVNQLLLSAKKGSPKKRRHSTTAAAAAAAAAKVLEEHGTPGSRLAAATPSRHGRWTSIRRGGRRVLGPGDSISPIRSEASQYHPDRHSPGASGGAPPFGATPVPAGPPAPVALENATLFTRGKQLAFAAAPPAPPVRRRSLADEASVLRSGRRLPSVDGSAFASWQQSPAYFDYSPASGYPSYPGLPASEYGRAVSESVASQLPVANAQHIMACTQATPVFRHQSSPPSLQATSLARTAPVSAPGMSYAMLPDQRLALGAPPPMSSAVSQRMYAPYQRR
ncbi:Kinesin-like protein unc-104 [Diplonema papillatum]|nr:Kinesin-like protein unc-104 [Diplonema papillatum]